MQVQDFECLDRKLELGASEAVGLCVQAFEVRRLLGLGVERGGFGGVGLRIRGCRGYARSLDVPLRPSVLQASGPGCSTAIGSATQRFRKC